LFENSDEFLWIRKESLLRATTHGIDKLDEGFIREGPRPAELSPVELFIDPCETLKPSRLALGWLVLMTCVRLQWLLHHHLCAVEWLLQTWLAPLVAAAQLGADSEERELRENDREERNCSPFNSARDDDDAVQALAHPQPAAVHRLTRSCTSSLFPTWISDHSSSKFGDRWRLIWHGT
jgi:hypothetical protein